jgi:uncharacterized protein
VLFVPKKKERSSMSTGIRGNLFSVAAVVSISAGLAIIACTVIVSRTYRDRFESPKKMDQSLAVTGSSRKRIVSDRAVWSLTVTVTEKDQKEAFAKLKKDLDQVQKFLKDRKFEASDIQLGALNSQPTYALDRRGQPSKEVESYTVSRSLTVSSPQVAAVSTAAPDITELIETGLNIHSGLPEYYYTKIGELKIEMIGEAAKDARSRADQIVTQAGCGISEVRNARMGVLQIVRPESTEVSSGGIYDTSTIEKDVTAVVSLTFGLTN